MDPGDRLSQLNNYIEKKTYDFLLTTYPSCITSTLHQAIYMSKRVHKMTKALPKEAPIATWGSKGIVRPKIDPLNGEKSAIPQKVSVMTSQN